MPTLHFMVRGTHPTWHRRDACATAYHMAGTEARPTIKNSRGRLFYIFPLIIPTEFGNRRFSPHQHRLESLCYRKWQATQWSGAVWR